MYSESNCILECSWKRAAKDCGCVPWYLAKDHFPTSPLCSLEENACFSQLVADRYKVSGECEESCLHDCEKTEYAIKFSSK